MGTEAVLNDDILLYKKRGGMELRGYPGTPKSNESVLNVIGHNTAFDTEPYYPSESQISVVSGHKQESRQDGLLGRGLLKQLEAVVIGSGEDMVFIDCKLPTSHVEISVPKVLVPTELQHRGATVWYSLETQNGIRRSRIREREVKPVPAESIFSKEELDWLSKE